MEQIVGTENWINLLVTYVVNEENKRIESLKKCDIDGALAGYFGNTVVFRDGNGQIVELIYYNADRTMRCWRNGAWVNAKWIINNGQDNSLIFHIYEIKGKPLCFCHPLAAYKKVGDRWISPETDAGTPVFPTKATPLQFLSSVPVVRQGRRSVIEGTNLDAGAVISLEEGLVTPPKDGYSTAQRDILSIPIEKANRPIEGYFGNSETLIDAISGKIMGIGYYRSDFTLRHWNNGSWVEGSAYMVNNGQDCSVFIRTRTDFFKKSSGFAHPFAPNKKVGDFWVSPEVWGGFSTDPLTSGGVPVIHSNGKYFIAGTDLIPRTVHTLIGGEIPPPVKD